VKISALIAVCACGLGVAGSAHACERTLGQQLASAENQLMASMAASLHAAVTATGTAHSDTADAGNGDRDVLDGVGSEASTAPPAGDLIGLPAKSAPASKGNRAPASAGGAVSNHDSGSRPPQGLGWQSLLPGSIQ
jgi:hypothetical protein